MASSGAPSPEPSGRPVALVTGASRGIGREVALAFARNGFDVALVARTVAEGGRGAGPVLGGAMPVPCALEDTAAEVRALGVDALAVPMDLLDGSSVLLAADRILETWGRVDVLVNNAYAQTAGSADRPQDLELDDATVMMRGNYRHQLALIQRVLPAMVERGSGVLINLVSGSATANPPVDGDWGLSHAASTAAFTHLADAVNAEYRHHGVRAFNLSPEFDRAAWEASRGDADEIATWTARASAWLATDPDADRFLGRVVGKLKPAATNAMGPGAMESNTVKSNAA